MDPNDLANTKGIAEHFELLPCDDLSIAISIQKYGLMNRPESRCRNDYPIKLKKLLKFPLKPEYLYNSILAPELPYDQRLCENLCVVNHWLPKCNCLMSDTIFYYNGGQENDSYSVCPSVEVQEIPEMTDNCMINSVYARTEAEVFDQCKCFKRCEGYAFEVKSYDKIKHMYGKFTIERYSLKMQLNSNVLA